MSTSKTRAFRSARINRNYRQHTVSADETVARIRYARKARQDSDLVIIARPDTMRTDGYAEGGRRAQLYTAESADMVMLVPNSAEKLRALLPIAAYRRCK